MQLRLLSCFGHGEASPESTAGIVQGEPDSRILGFAQQRHAPLSQEKGRSQVDVHHLGPDLGLVMFEWSENSDPGCVVEQPIQYAEGVGDMSGDVTQAVDGDA